MFFIRSQSKNESMHGKRAQVEADEGLTDSMNGFNPMAELEFFRMARPYPLSDLRLKDYREPVIEFSCRRCDRHGALERKLLVKAFAAGASFAVLCRRMAMGCERMQTPEGDKCGAHFPCLGDVDGPDGSQS